MKWTDETKAAAKAIILDLKDVVREVGVPSQMGEEEPFLEFIVSRQRKAHQACPIVSEEFASARRACDLLYPELPCLQ